MMKPKAWRRASTVPAQATLPSALEAISHNVSLSEYIAWPWGTLQHEEWELTWEHYIVIHCHILARATEWQACHVLSCHNTSHVNVRCDEWLFPECESPVLGSSDAGSRTGPGLPPCLSPGAGPHLLPVFVPLADVSLSLSDPDVTRVSDHWVLSPTPVSAPGSFPLTLPVPVSNIRLSISSKWGHTPHTASCTDGNIDVSLTQLYAVKFLVGNCPVLLCQILHWSLNRYSSVESWIHDGCYLTMEGLHDAIWQGRAM